MTIIKYIYTVYELYILSKIFKTDVWLARITLSFFQIVLNMHAILAVYFEPNSNI